VVLVQEFALLKHQLRNKNSGFRGRHSKSLFYQFFNLNSKII
jgi:hypothetical protein